MLEILFSIFILSVGLLGLLALIPVGTADVAEATKSDRGAVTGRAAHRDVKVRKMLYPGMWMNHIYSDDPAMTFVDYATPLLPQTWWELDEPGAPVMTGPPTPSPVNHGHSVCIDPLFVARNHQTFVNITGVNSLPAEWPGRAFPYFLDNDPGAVSGPPITSDPPGLLAPRMSRVTLRSWPSKYAPMMNTALADRVFRWQDDLLFDSPTDETLRPQAIIDTLGRGQSEGNYSWLATLTPADGTADVGAGERRVYNYSVVVFYKRNLDIPVTNPSAALAADNSWQLNDRGVRPSERIVWADFPSATISFGGGDVRLRLVCQSGGANTDPSLIDKSDFTNIRTNNWILLSGYLEGSTEHQSVFQWYRVLAVDDGPLFLDGSAAQPTVSGNPEWVRDITLAGPDWDPMMFQDVDGNPTFRTTFATLVEGVVAVFTKTVELDTWSGM